MQELRLVAISEDGSYAVLAAPGSGGRFSLPVDDRLRIVARGQFSRLAQYEIEVESPLRPKEIQDRIRAGETAEEIADAAGLPIERVRRFEGPVLAERVYRAQEAQGAALRRPGDSGPGRPLGEVVSERLRAVGADPEDAEWDSRKRSDGTWQVQLTFSSGSRPYLAEWVFDPRRKHVAPADDTAARLCLSSGELPGPAPRADGPATATVTPIGSRLGPAAADHDPRRPPVPPPTPAHAPPPHTPPAYGSPAYGSPAYARPTGIPPAYAPPTHSQPSEGEHEERQAAVPAPPQASPQGRPARKAAGGRSRRASVPSWDEIMFGTSRQSD